MILWTNQNTNKKAFRKLCACQRTSCCETRILITEQTSCCETRILITVQTSCGETRILITVQTSCGETRILITVQTSCCETRILITVQTSCCETRILITEQTSCGETRILITVQTSCGETRILNIAQSIFCNCRHTDNCNLKSSSCDTHQLTVAAGLRPILTIATEHCLLQYQPDLLYTVTGQVQATYCTIHTQKPWTGTAWCIYSSI